MLKHDCAVQFSDKARNSGKPQSSDSSSSRMPSSSSYRPTGSSITTQSAAGQQGGYVSAADWQTKGSPVTMHRTSDISQSSVVGNIASQDKDTVRKNSLPTKGDGAKKQPPAPPMRRVGFGGGDAPPPASSVAPPAFDVMLLKQMVENNAGFKKVAGSDGDSVGSTPSSSSFKYR